MLNRPRCTFHDDCCLHRSQHFDSPPSEISCSRRKGHSILPEVKRQFLFLLELVGHLIEYLQFLRLLMWLLGLFLALLILVDEQLICNDKRAAFAFLDCLNNSILAVVVEVHLVVHDDVQNFVVDANGAVLRRRKGRRNVHVQWDLVSHPWMILDLSDGCAFCRIDF